MNFAVLRPAIVSVFLGVTAIRATSAQGLQVDVEEFKRLVAEVADLRDANSALQKKVVQLQSRNESLADALRQSNERSMTKMADFATRDDLARIVEKIKEVDQRRESDRKLILEEFEKLTKTLSQPVEKSERNSRKHSKEKEEKESNKSSEADPKPLEGTFYSYKVKKGDMLETVLKDYNKQLKEEGRPTITAEQVKQANPNLSPNKLLVGKEILLPVPDKKK
ncbi:MAG TPA: LysM domain-containing protein [Verrucomicrobiae bacterium]|nr:LysM domain-containing protein [Verrucomicrobiae bacterium]